MISSRTMGTVRLKLTLLAAILGLFGLAAQASAALRVTVQPGDTLSGIAARHGISVATLAGDNGLRDADVIVAGRSLSIPGSGGGIRVSGGGAYTVRAGDTLSGIASRFGTTASSIARANGIANAHLIVAGSRLRIGGGGSRAATWIGGTSYTVRPGENLGAIAARFGTTAAALARANGIRDPNVVVAGTRLRVSGAGSGSSSAVRTASGAGTGYHTVQVGENLAAIAARFGTTSDRVASLNGIANPDLVVAGTRLRVPGGSVAMSSGPLTPVTAGTSGWGNQPSKRSIAALMAQHAARHGVDVALVRAIGWQESGWWQGARSSTGAIGVMQLMPGTAAWLGPALLGRTIDPYRASDNVEAGAAYLAYLQRQTGSQRLAIAAYYQGLGSVTGRGLLAETESYVGSVTSFIGRV